MSETLVGEVLDLAQDRFEAALSVPGSVDNVMKGYRSTPVQTARVVDFDTGVLHSITPQLLSVLLDSSAAPGVLVTEVSEGVSFPADPRRILLTKDKALAKILINGDNDIEVGERVLVDVRDSLRRSEPRGTTQQVSDISFDNGIIGYEAELLALLESGIGNVQNRAISLLKRGLSAHFCKVVYLDDELVPGANKVLEVGFIDSDSGTEGKVSNFITTHPVPALDYRSTEVEIDFPYPRRIYTHDGDSEMTSMKLSIEGNDAYLLNGQISEDSPEITTLTIDSLAYISMLLEQASVVPLKVANE